MCCGDQPQTVRSMPKRVLVAVCLAAVSTCVGLLVGVALPGLRDEGGALDTVGAVLIVVGTALAVAGLVVALLSSRRR